MRYKYCSIVIMLATVFLGSVAFAETPQNDSAQMDAVEEVIASGEMDIMVRSVSEERIEDVRVVEWNITATDDTQAASTEDMVVAGIEEDFQEGLENIEQWEGPSDYWGYKNLGIANVENHLNIRETPGEDGKLIGKMSNNAACEILEISDGWAHITSGKLDGYVSMDYLLTGPEAIVRASEVVEPMATVTTEVLRVREQPNVDCPVITTVPYGEELEVLNVLDGWVEVDMDGEPVYVSAEYVTVAEKLSTAITMTELLYGEGVSDVRVDICQYAKQFIGNPYVWGGTSLTNGADCSGFVLSLYAKYGITLPHSSRAQANCGRRVALSEIKPGDLVFYTK
ncbi:MAG: SH3 domain-containing protein, partial [Lachnospiraceae bacterium]